eukprot:scaffold1763_cov181-Amphora_coffeaeformis.AAC.7
MSKDDLKYAAILLKISSAEQAVLAPTRPHSEKSPVRMDPANSGGVSKTSVKPTSSQKTYLKIYPPIPESIVFTSATAPIPSLSAEETSPEDDNTQDNAVTELTDTQRFIAFFKILVLCTVRSTPEQKERIVIHRNIKALVTECTNNCPNDECLQDRLEIKLRCYVGEHAWKVSRNTFSAFCRRRQIQ